MKKVFLLICLLPLFAHAQKIPESGFDKVRVVLDNSIIQADLTPVTDDPELSSDKFYYWYSANKIHSTQGGFSGRLLNGNYAEYFPNKNLKEQGTFAKGLKDGIWKTWNENGTLLQFYTWKRGFRSGKYFVCDDKGFIKQSGRYKKNEVVVRDSIPLWKRINPFKKSN